MPIKKLKLPLGTALLLFTMSIHASDSPDFELTITDVLIEDANLYVVLHIANHSSSPAYVKRHSFCDIGDQNWTIINQSGFSALPHMYFNFGPEYFYSKHDIRHRYVIHPGSRIDCTVNIAQSFPLPSNTFNIAIQTYLSVNFTDSDVTYGVSSNIYEVDLSDAIENNTNLTDTFSELDLGMFPIETDFSTPGVHVIRNR